MQLNNSGLFKRIMANWLDSLLFSTLYLLALQVFGQYVVKIMASTEATPTKLLTIALNFLVFNLVWLAVISIVRVIYNTVLVASNGGTFGKILYGLKILNTDGDTNLSKGTAFWRYTAGYAFSAQMFGLGFFKIIKHPRKLGWHDELFKTHVAVVSSPIKGVLATIALIVINTILIVTFASQVVLPLVTLIKS